METLKKIWIDEFICLRIKLYAFNCGNDSENKLKAICKSQSESIKFEEYLECLSGNDYQQDCGFYLIRAIIMKNIFNEYSNLH